MAEQADGRKKDAKIISFGRFHYTIAFGQSDITISTETPLQ